MEKSRVPATLRLKIALMLLMVVLVSMAFGAYLAAAYLDALI